MKKKFRELILRFIDPFCHYHQLETADASKSKPATSKPVSARALLEKYIDNVYESAPPGEFRFGI
jgi:hypothetical protein